MQFGYNWPSGFRNKSFEIVDEQRDNCGRCLPIL